MIEEQFEWYLENQDELVKKYNGRYLVISGKAVVGDYDNESTALSEASKKYGLGNFIIQLCTPGEEAYTQTFHSRVIFA